MFIDTKQPLREALKGPFGSQILEGLQPELGRAGLTRNDFAKAVANPAARFFGSDENIANRQLAPGEVTADWNKNIYEGQNVSAMPRDESLGADPNPFTGFRSSPNVEDRRNELALTLAQQDALGPPGQWTARPGEEPAAGGALGEALGTNQISNLEANATMRGVTQGAQAPRAVDDPFESDVADGGFNAIDAAAEPEATSMRDFPSPANDYSMFQQDPAATPDTGR